MNIEANTTTARYARAIAASKRIHWDIDDDVIRGRTLDVADNYLPDGLSLGRRAPVPHRRRNAGS